MKVSYLRVTVGVTFVAALVLGMALTGGCRAAPTGEVTPIKVGGIYALTGYMAEDAVAPKHGFEMAVADINADGGLLGRPLEIHMYDIGDFAPETEMLAADELVQGTGVNVVIGGWSGWGQDVEAFGRYDVPTFLYDFADSTTEALRAPGNDNCFHTGEGEIAYSIWHWNYFLMNLPYEWPNKKLALIGADDSWGRGVVDTMTELGEEQGWEVVVSEIVPYGTTEWGPILAKIRATEPALLVYEVPSATDEITFFRQFMLDPTPTIIDYGWSMSVVGFMREMGEEANGLLGMPGGFIALPPPTPEVADWVERYMEKYGSVSGDCINTGCADVTYTSTMMWAEAVRQVGDPTNYDAIIQWIKDTPYQAMPGMRVYDFVEPNILLEEQHQQGCAQVQDGQFYVLYHIVYGDPYVDYQGKSYSFQVPPWME